MEIRRVITGLRDGRAAFVHDDVVPAVSPPLLGNEIVRLWGFDDGPAVPGTHGPLPGSAAFFPPPGGLRAVVWTVPPPDAGDTRDDAHAHTADEELVPGMAAVPVDADGLHATPTLDFHLVLTGAVDFVLEGGARTTLRAGDVLVVNGQPHAWRNETGSACTLLGVFYGATT
jgi:hypothetical protein